METWLSREGRRICPGILSCGTTELGHSRTDSPLRLEQTPGPEEREGAPVKSDTTVESMAGFKRSKH